jgi:hypothetical protein
MLKFKSRQQRNDRLVIFAPDSSERRKGVPHYDIPAGVSAKFSVTPLQHAKPSFISAFAIVGQWADRVHRFASSLYLVFICRQGRP